MKPIKKKKDSNSNLKITIYSKTIIRIIER